MAISINSTSFGSATATSLTFAHTCSGSDGALVVGIIAGNADVISGVTYNAVTMTRINFRNNGNSTAYLYYILGPSTGANNIVVSATLSVAISAEALSLTGVGQSSQPDASVTNVASATTSCANTLTTVANNSIHIATFAVDAYAVSSITGATLVNIFMGYSPIKTPAGSSTLTGNSGGVNAWATVGASFSPSLSSATTETGYSFFI